MQPSHEIEEAKAELQSLINGAIVDDAKNLGIFAGQPTVMLAFPMHGPKVKALIKQLEGAGEFDAYMSGSEVKDWTLTADGRPLDDSCIIITSVEGLKDHGFTLPKEI